MALQIHSAPSADLLLDELVRQLSVQHADPFGRDVVVVPSSGMREYLIEHLCRRLPARNAAGPLLANVEFIYPNEFNMRVLGHRRHLSDAWGARVLRWSVLAELENDQDLLPGYRTARRRLGRAEKAALLFEKYAAQRPTMLVDWAENRCTDGFGALDATRSAGYGWQFQLWRRVRARLGTSHAEKVRDRRPAIEDGARYHLFALEFFSPAKITLLAQLGQAEVGVFMLQAPSAVEIEMIPGAAEGRAISRATFTPADYVNALNRSWAALAHETYALVGALANKVGVSVSRVVPEPRHTLLSHLQQVIITDHDLDEEPIEVSPTVAADHSVQVHLCHGVTRQVQVLRDVLLHLFQNDPTLHPRDINVLCNDLDRFAPLLGPMLHAGGHPVPVTIVDRSITTRTTAEMAIASLLDVLEQRCTVDEFLDLLSHDAIRARVNLSEDEVALVAAVLPSVDIRWGLDGAHRARWGYSATDEISTWRHAIDRMLLGALIQGAEGREVLQGITPAADIDGQTAVAVGKVSSLLTQLQELSLRCTGNRSLGEWSDVLRTMLDEVLAVSDDDAWMLDNLRVLAEQMATAGAEHPSLSLAPLEFFAQVRAALQGVAARSRQWADAVRVATPETLRGVPARVVVMLGMDEQRLRKGGVDGDDLLATSPHVGDRDPRNEHRLGLLTAICSASDTVVVLADGHSVTDNTEIPPAMPVRELIDHVAQLCGLPPNGRLPFVVHHSRQATDVVNLGVQTDESKKDVGSFVDGPFTFDGGAIEIAKQVLANGLRTSVVEMPGVLPAPSDDELRTELTIRDLVRSVSKPIDVYLQDRLRLRLPDEEDASDAAIELWPASLALYGLGNGLMQAALAGDDNAAWQRTRALEGGVPPGALGERLWSEISTQVDALTEAAGVGAAKPTPHTLKVAIDGTPFTVRDVVHTIGDEILQITYSTWSPHRRLQPLFQLAALTLHDSSVEWKARIVARTDSDKGPPVVVESFGLAGATSTDRAASAASILRFGADMRARALRAPVLMFERASWLWGDSARTTVEKKLRSDLYNRAHSWVLPYATPENEVELFRYLSGVPGGELERDLPAGDCAAEQYGNALRSMWNSSVTVSQSAEPEKKSKGKGAK